MKGKLQYGFYACCTKCNTKIYILVFLLKNTGIKLWFFFFSGSSIINLSECLNLSISMYRVLQNSVSFRGKIMTFPFKACPFVFPCPLGCNAYSKGFIYLFYLLCIHGSKFKTIKHYNMSVTLDISTDTGDSPRSNDGLWLLFPSQSLTYSVQVY